MASRQVDIASSVGLHARPAALFVQEATATGLPVTIAKQGGDPVDARSILAVMALGAATVESAVFLEASAFYTLAVATIHGLEVTSIEHEETLVMTILLGANGTSLLSGAVGKSGKASGSLAGGALSLPSVGDLRKKLVSRFVRKFAVRRAALLLGKLAPAGVGAAFGGWGNRRLGSMVIATARSTFGTPPPTWNAA